MSETPVSRRQILSSAVALGAVSAIGSAFVGPADAATRRRTPPLSAEEMAAIATAIGKKGTYVEAEGVYTVPLPRNDLSVQVQGHVVPISFGFGGWVSIKRTLDGRGAVLMSDTVLLQEEVNPLISAVHANGLEVAAIHNHFFYEEPRIVYMHIHGAGKATDLAQKYAGAIKESKLLPANQQPAGPAPAHTAKELFDLAALDAIVGCSGTVNGASYKYTVGRDDLTVLCMGAQFTAAIGVNTWAAFAGTTTDAAIAGDVAMLETEVNPVIRVLRQHNLEVVALHHHMLGEQPRVLFLHYYGRGAADVLARGFRAALEVLGKPAQPMPMMHAPY